jgi:hypothetical protein
LGHGLLFAVTENHPPQELGTAWAAQAIFVKAVRKVKAAAVDVWIKKTPLVSNRQPKPRVPAEGTTHVVPFSSAHGCQATHGDGPAALHHPAGLDILHRHLAWVADAHLTKPGKEPVVEFRAE